MPDGRHVPGTHAEHSELEAIAKEVGKAGGLMQNVLNLGGDFEGEAELLRKEAQASGGRVLFSITAGAKDSSGQRVRSMLEEMQSNGLDINSISTPRGTGFISGLQCGLPWKSGAWQTLASKDLADRLATISNPDQVAILVAEAQRTEGTNPSDLFYMGNEERPNYVGSDSESLAGLALAAMEHPAETFLRMARESNGKALFTLRSFNKNLNALANLLSCDYCLPGLGDAGAHVSQVMDGGYLCYPIGVVTKNYMILPRPYAD